MIFRQKAHRDTMTKNALRAMASVAIAALVLAAALSCEKTDSGDGDGTFRIEPPEITLSADVSSVQISALNGEPPITWSVSDSAAGKIVGEGSNVIYSSNNQGPNQIKAVDYRGRVATALVIGEGSAGVLAIIPTEATVAASGGVAVFTATGGSGSYTWNTPVYGTLAVSADGRSATYLSTNAGTDAVVVYSGGAVASATVKKIE